MDGFAVADSLLKSLDLNSIGSLVSLGSDIVILVDRNDVVYQVFLGGHDLSDYGLSKTVGQRLQDCVTIESVPKIDSMLSPSTTHHPVRGYQVNHKCSGRPDLPVLYSVHRAKDFPYTIIVGREMRQQMLDQQRLVQTQMELEADYRELKEAETRYRTAFKVATVAYIMLDGERRTILDANPAASTLMSSTGAPLSGKSIRDLFAKQDRDRVGDAISEARHSPGPVDLDGVTIAKGEPVSLTIRSYRENGITNVLLAIWPADQDHETSRQRTERPVSATAVEIADLPEAVVQTDAEGQVIAANTLFLDLIHAPSLTQVLGRNIGSWFSSAAIDIRVLYTRLLDEPSIRGFSSILTDNLSAESSVSISARLNVSSNTIQLIVVPQASNSDRLTIPSPGVPEQAEGFSALVGKVPLKDLIRESLDVIEKICIEAALDQTNNNRAYAAEILGLSRQSLYIKLRRHGLEDYRPGSGRQN
jgi:transcriptional regulator PpsR